MTTKLQDPETAAKTHWAILSRLLYFTLPLLVNGKFVSCFCEKNKPFSNIFSAISTPIKNSSILPLFPYRINARITLFHFTEEDLPLMINTLDPANAHGCDRYQ